MYVGTRKTDNIIQYLIRYFNQHYRQKYTIYFYIIDKPYDIYITVWNCNGLYNLTSFAFKIVAYCCSMCRQPEEDIIWYVIDLLERAIKEYENNIKERISDDNTVKQCPNCGANRALFARKCEFCGTEFVTNIYMEVK